MDRFLRLQSSFFLRIFSISNLRNRASYPLVAMTISYASEVLRNSIVIFLEEVNDVAFCPFISIVFCL